MLDLAFSRFLRNFQLPSTEKRDSFLDEQGQGSNEA